MSGEVDRILYRPAEAAEAIGVSRSRIYELINSGTIPSIRVGNTVRVPVADLEKWVSDQVAARVPASQ